MSTIIAMIDNDEAARAAMSALAEKEGWTLSSFPYAESRLERIQQINPDLIVLDIDKFRLGGGWELLQQLKTEARVPAIDAANPELNVLDFDRFRSARGWEFLQLLKMEEETATIPIIVTAIAFDLPAEIKAYLASREIIVLPKPLNLEKFALVARQLLDGQNPLILNIDRKMPILLVEDTLVLAEAFVSILELEGYAATTVANGQLALDAIRSGRHSLIFLDMNMPVMNGYEFLEAYALQPGPHTAVVVFSAYGIDDAELPFPPFVIGRLTKPFEIVDLLAIITQFALPV